MTQTDRLDSGMYVLRASGDSSKDYYRYNLSRMHNSEKVKLFVEQVTMEFHSEKFADVNNISFYYNVSKKNIDTRECIIKIVVDTFLGTSIIREVTEFTIEHASSVSAFAREVVNELGSQLRYDTSRVVAEKHKDDWHYIVKGKPMEESCPMESGTYLTIMRTDDLRINVEFVAVSRYSREDNCWSLPRMIGELSGLILIVVAWKEKPEGCDIC
jgi:hypothetical protein